MFEESFPDNYALLIIISLYGLKNLSDKKTPTDDCDTKTAEEKAMRRNWKNALREERDGRDYQKSRNRNGRQDITQGLKFFIRISLFCFNLSFSDPSRLSLQTDEIIRFRSASSGMSVSKEILDLVSIYLSQLHIPWTTHL